MLVSSLTKATIRRVTTHLPQTTTFFEKHGSKIATGLESALFATEAYHAGRTLHPREEAGVGGIYAVGAAIPNLGAPVVYAALATLSLQHMQQHYQERMKREGFRKITSLSSYQNQDGERAIENLGRFRPRLDTGR